MLHIPIHDGEGRAFCGPLAIAAVTGLSVMEIREIIYRIRRKRDRKQYGAVISGGRTKDIAGRRKPIRGMYNSELVAVMKRLGYKVGGPRVMDKWDRYKTLGEFCASRGHTGPYIVNVTKHYVAVSHGVVCDTITRTPVPIDQYPKLRSRVDKFWSFSKRTRGDEPEAVPGYPF